MIVPKAHPTPAQLGGETQRILQENIPNPTTAKYPVSLTPVGSGSAVVILDVLDPEYWRIDKIAVFNTSGSSDHVNVYLAPDGDAAASGNQIGKIAVGALGLVDIPELEGVVMAPTDRLIMQTVAEDMTVVGGVTRLFSGS